MSVSTSTQSATGVGIFMENSSGGMVNDLSFTGGKCQTILLIYSSKAGG
jgi:hypothetical protein